MNLFKTQSQPKPVSNAASRFRQYVDKDNGVIQVYLPPKLDDERRQKKAAITKTRDAAINVAVARRDERVRAAKQAYEAALKEIDAEHRTAVAKADQAFDAADHEINASLVQPLSAEQVALLTTKPGEIVRVPEAKVA